MATTTTTTTFSPKTTKHYNVRCISLPAARSHPTTLKLEQELNKLESWEILSSPSSSSSSTNAEKILSALSGLGELYKCIGDLLALPLTQQVLAQHRHENWVNQLLDGLLRYLDICGNTRDSILLMKESVRVLESAFRRSKCGELIIQGNVTAYISSRKKMVKNLASLLKAIKDCSSNNSPDHNSDQNHHHVNVLSSSVIRVLMIRSSLITTSMLHSLLSYLSAVSPMSSSNTKWSLISKLFHKWVATIDSQFEENEFESVDIALSEVLLHQQSSKVDQLEKVDDHHDDEKIESANVKLEALDCVIGGFEDALESLFRRLIHARVSLLNIISH
ncbi:hypothetical protein LWI29_031039 [Acer saccharum]|uniref:Uncharacterized protein n=1 Tax=Acer saccharum TaxID=4024 RepID=A0AA39TLE5_ACESA|nr:hypothetical protein LWI29_031039 [Acer saccharum]